MLATALAWALTWPFVESIRPMEPVPELGRTLTSAGYLYRHRREGRGETRFGRYGLPAIEDVRAIEGPSVAIWGDSYVEALQVADEDKVAQRVTQGSEARLGGRITGVALARGGWAVPDYVFLLPRVEKLFAPRAHVVILAAIEDALPDGTRFTLPGGLPQLTERVAPAKAPRARQLLAGAGLHFLWAGVRNASGSGRSLRFRPGPRSAKPKTDKHDEAAELPPTGAVEFLLDRLKAGTDKPIIFVYTPSVPRIRRGIVDLVDPDQAAADVVAAACASRGIDFVNLGPVFTKAYRETGAFPRGFHNGVPSRGHWNERGHRLVAEGILRALERHRVALHTD